MKPLIRAYLASLKEREELDAILPDLLSELGFNVISRPRRGTTQRGVDVAAVGKDDGDQKLFLFSVKPGDLSRTDWGGSHDQALRQSLDEILDGYLPSRVPPRYRQLKVVICICVGGEIREDVRDLVSGYTAARTTDLISFDEWNGDRLAGLLLDGALREEVLPKPMRAAFQKAVALVDEPDVAYRHFRDLTRQLVAASSKSNRSRLRAGRQLCLCAWILFVWSRDVENVEAAVRVCELALLVGWEIYRPIAGAKSADAKALHQVILQLVELNLRSSLQLVETKLLPHADVADGLSMAVHSQNALDVNLALFEMLGRIGTLGIWAHWVATIGGRAPSPLAEAELRRLLSAGLKIIENNHILLLPITDEQATDVALFLQFWLLVQSDGERVAWWLSHMTSRLIYTLRSQGRYPTSFSDYRDLIDHPKEQSDVYFREATAGSTLIPLLACWLASFGLADDLRRLSRIVADRLGHCTLQLWTPDANSEAHIYLNDDSHGLAICDLPIDDTGIELLAVLQSAVAHETGIDALSAVKGSLWPIVLTACRHYRLPVPPRFWIEAMQPIAADGSSGGATHPADQ